MPYCRRKSDRRSSNRSRRRYRGAPAAPGSSIGFPHFTGALSQVGAGRDFHRASHRAPKFCRLVLHRYDRGDRPIMPQQHNSAGLPVRDLVYLGQSASLEGGNPYHRFVRFFPTHRAVPQIVRMSEPFHSCNPPEDRHRVLRRHRRQAARPCELGRLLCELVHTWRHVATT
jgi:hypothetical protein